MKALLTIILIAGIIGVSVSSCKSTQACTTKQDKCKTQKPCCEPTTKTYPF